MTWGDVDVSSGGTGAGFLKIKSGGAVKVHILEDEPYSFHSVFFQGVKKSAVVDPESNPTEGIKGFDTRKRHAINVFDYSDSKVKVLAGSNTLFNQLKAIHEEWGSFAEVDLKISRTGEGFDTTYQVVPTAKCQWDDSLLEGQELNDLNSVFAITDDATIQNYMEGIDSAKDAVPDEEVVPEEDGSGEPAGEEPVVEEEAAPVKRPVPTKVAPKPAAQPTRPLGRSELIMKLNAAIKTKLRYKKPGMMLADVQKFGGKDKKSMSQLGQEDLAKLLKFVQTVK